MNPDSGNEKGGAEFKVKYTRKKSLSLSRVFLSLSDYNRQLLTECDEDADREHYHQKDETIQERFSRDKKALSKLPVVPFDTDLYIPAHTDKWGKFTLNKVKYTYSASPGLAAQDIWLCISTEFVKVMDADHLPVVTHRRLYGDKECLESMEWLLYLKYIAESLSLYVTAGYTA